MQVNPLFKLPYPNFDFEYFFMQPDLKQKMGELSEKIINQNQKPSVCFIYGASGAGKTHSLKALTNLALKNQLSSIYIKASSLNADQLPLISENLDLLCLDDVQSLNKNIQLSIYELINKNQSHLIFSSSQAPNELNVINDLKTRLISGTQIFIPNLDDCGLKKALHFKCKSIGINASCKKIDYLLTKSKRNMKDLVSNLDSLIKYCGAKNLTFKAIDDFFNQSNENKN